MMSFKSRIICFLLVAATVIPLVRFHTNALPSVSAQSALLMEAEHGTVLYASNANTRLPMASTTKIMTALVAIEHVSPETIVTVAPEAIGVEGSSIYLTADEQLTMEQLLYALLLQSANDAAVAIAVAVAGSVEAFSELMNQKAAELGLTDTQFRTPHGLDADGHYTTAYELAKITRCALENELFFRIVSTPKATIPHAGKEDARLLVNHNKMLRLYDGCIGVKTGYTKKSGRCLVSAAEHDGIRLIAVTLNAPDDWNDHTDMLDYGFSLLKSEILCDANQICHLAPLVGGITASVAVSNPDSLRVTLPKDHPEIMRTVELPRFLYAPVTAGEQVGKVIFRCDLDGDGNAETIGETALCVQCAAEKKPGKKSFWQWLCSLFGG